MNSRLKEMTTPKFPLESVEQVAKACGVPDNVQILAAPVGMRDQLLQDIMPQEAAALILCVLYAEAKALNQEATAEGVLLLLSQKPPVSLRFHYQDEENIKQQLISILEEGLGKKLTQSELSLFEESRAVALGLAFFVCLRAGRSIKMADVAVSMNLESIRGETGAFDARLHELARPFPGQIESAANVRHLVNGSKVVTDEGRYRFGYDKKPRVQDAISVRATPQTHGGVRDIFHWAVAQIQHDLYQNTKNLFRTEYAMDALATALADMAHISERRSFRLNETRLSYGLPMNLVPDELGINYGLPIVQSTQAAEVAELKLMTLPSSALKQKGEVMAYHSVCRLIRILVLLDRVIAVEVLMCAQAMDIVKNVLSDLPFGKGTSAVHKRLRETVAFMDENRFVAPDMQEAERLLAEGELLTAAEEAIGRLQ